MAATQPLPDKLYVVTAISNPCRYRTRYDLYEAFARQVAASGALLYTVELAFGARPFEVTQAGNPQHVQVRGSCELWHKENLLNLGIARLPPEAQYIATIDADLTFARPDWVQETLQQLQHYPLVQMFSDIQQLDSGSKSIGQGLSFVEAWQRGMLLKTPNGQASSTLAFHPNKVKLPPYPPPGCCELGAPGGAWAYCRSTLDALGGLMEDSLVGAADYFMAAALYGLADLVLATGYTPAFVASVKQWEARALAHVKKNVGVVSGLVLHHWHGPMAARGYGERWQLLVKHQFNPATDLKRDSQGLLTLEDNGDPRLVALRDDLRQYFRSRNEDQQSS